MLASLLKVLLFFAVILAIAVGLNTLSATSEGVRVVFNGMEYTLGPIQAVVALVVLMVAAWILFKLLGMVWAFLRFIMGDETAINRYFARSRREKGIEALSQGLLAVAAGEGKQAQDMANRAAKYLDDTRATRLLAAQAAEVVGDDARAEAVYREMLEDDRTRFVGVRGLMKQKLAKGDTQTALQLAQKAYALKPRHVEIQNTLLELSTREGDWKGARGILKDKRKQGELPQDVHIRRDAVLALQEARDVLAQGTSISAREAAISAAKASPDLIPAVVLAAQTYVAQKDNRNAERLLEKAWSVRPHPDLAEAFAAIVPDETPNQRLRRFEALMKKNPNDEETRLLRAELLLANEDFPGARRALGDLAETHPTTRSLAIMAAVERGEGGSDDAVRAWLVKAMSASRGPQWVCDKCENVMEDWSPVCSNCSGFDTLTWREPAQKRNVNIAGGAELLPLLIGSPKESGSRPANGRPAAGNATTKEAAAAASVVADVPPGMVPRESDFVAGSAPEPARTITDPEPPLPQSPAPASPPAAKPDEPAPGLRPAPIPKAAPRLAEADASLIRPDVEPPEDAPRPQRAASRPATPVIDGDTPVRPDVEPVDPAERMR